MTARTHKVTLNERVYYQIKSMIALRELLPGASLVTRTLASQLGVSRMPVLEAIRRLERDGLVTVFPKWGAAVKEWSQEELFEAYCIRRALEGEAARFFVLRATSEDKRKLVELSDLFDKLAVSDPVKCDETDMEFHLHIVRSTRLQRLYELVENSKIETAVLLGLSITAYDQPNKREWFYAKSIGSHKPVVKALLGTDPGVAEQAIRQHIDIVLEQLMKLEQKEEEPTWRRPAGG